MLGCTGDTNNFTSSFDPSELACADGVDNDGDTFIDFPDDPECTAGSDGREDI